MITSVLLWAVIIAIGVVAYLIGHGVGYDEGVNAGYMKGHREGQAKWIKAMEKRRGPDGQDALVRIIDPTRQTPTS